MGKKTIAELLAESKAIKETIRCQRDELKQCQITLAIEYTSLMTPEAKQKEIDECETILKNIANEYDTLAMKFKNDKKALKEKVAFAQERLAFINYKVNHSLPKKKYGFNCDGNYFVFTGEGIKEIRVDFTKANWKKVLEEELKKQGLQNNGARVIDNITYKAGKTVELHLAPVNK